MIKLKRYDNYQIMCKECDLPIKTGNAKISQLKALAKICHWVRDGNAYIIDEIYKKRFAHKPRKWGYKYLKIRDDYFDDVMYAIDKYKLRDYLEIIEDKDVNNYKEKVKRLEEKLQKYEDKEDW